MPLTLNDDQRMLKEAAQAFLAERAPVAHLRGLRDSEDALGFCPALLQEMADLGWCSIAIPEAYGGLGWGLTELAIVLEEMGRTLAPSPLIQSQLLGADIIATLGSDEQKSHWLPAIAAGRTRVALAIDDHHRHDPEDSSRSESTAVKTSTGDYVLNARKPLVADGHHAHAIIVIAQLDGELALFIVPGDAAGFQARRLPTIDHHPAADLTFTDVAMDKAQRLIGHDLDLELTTCLDRARIGLSAMLLGIAVEAFERTLGYLKERKQFGQIIGSFQSLQHRAAVLHGELELSRSLLLHALKAVDRDDPELAKIASMTKARLGQTAHLATTEAIQMHGGIGMTDEFDIGFYLKRSQVLEQWLGDHHYHLERLARLAA